MTAEIELKAHVKDPEGTRAVMDKKLAFAGTFDKEDAYWFTEPDANPVFPSSGLRIRKETFTGPSGSVSAAVLATYKIKEVREGMEINDEKEFSVGKAEEFEDFLRLLGFSCKKKNIKQVFHLKKKI